VASLAPVDLGTGRTAESIAPGVFHTCAVLDDDSIKCWGGNSSGELGLDDTVSRGDQPGEMGDALPAVDFDDVTSPTVTIDSPADTATYGRGQAVTVDFTCTDLVGVASCVGDVADGQALDTSALGTFTFTVTSLDTAGNSTQVTSTYTVAPPGVCDGRTVTVNLAFGQTPTNGNDVILGRPTAETINGRGGHDRICGGGGNDTLVGGTGNDRLFGQGGNDRVDGGIGNDRLDGGIGNDTLNGQAGTDALFGLQGLDRLNGGTQRDTCDGGPQRDAHVGGCEVRRNIP
jgi:Ca2+-binding RTX toxin-like protein